MGLCKTNVAGPLVKGSTRKYSGRGQPPTVSENEAGNVLGDCLGELEEMGLDDALGAIIEEHPDLDALHSTSRPLWPVRVRVATWLCCWGPGCRAEHERPDRLYVNLVHWTDAQRTKGKYVRLDDKDAAIFSTPFRQKDQDLSKHTLIHPRRWHPHEHARALEGAKHCP